MKTQKAAPPPEGRGGLCMPCGFGSERLNRHDFDDDLAGFNVRGDSDDELCGHRRRARLEPRAEQQHHFTSR